MKAVDDYQRHEHHKQRRIDLGEDPDQVNYEAAGSPNGDLDAGHLEGCGASALGLVNVLACD